jgi:1-deoxy-D-xylulose-5-phosphate reductoisomerase
VTSVCILGSTGTIGVNTLDVISSHPEHFKVAALTAQENVELLATQARAFCAPFVAIHNKAHYPKLKELLAGTKTEISVGEAGILAAAQIECDVVMSAIVGAAGLKPTLAAIAKGRRIALANKECLVCAGELVNRSVKEYHSTIIPVDSEHSGIFQLLPENNTAFISEITLTASGGPFRNFSTQQLIEVTPEQAIKHPNWRMGAKISVDSATLMNKGLELIEAHYLFAVESARLKAIIHPESIVHALVGMIDGSVLAQMSHPDMRAPIAYALAWPKRIETQVKKLNLADLGSLTFETPDELKFPALRLARDAMQQGGSAPCVLNAANEVAVARFLQGNIGFLDITKIVERTLETMDNKPVSSLEDVLAVDQTARHIAEKS